MACRALASTFDQRRFAPFNPKEMGCTSGPDGICNSKHHLKQLLDERDHAAQVSKKIELKLNGPNIAKKIQVWIPVLFGAIADGPDHGDAL